MRKILLLSIVSCSITISCLFFGCTKKIHSKELILREELSIGVESGDEKYVFAGIENIALDSEENIYLLDRRNYRIQKFDNNGNYLISIKIERGEGPQELSLIYGIAVTEDGLIYALDSNGAKFLVFNEEGMFLQSFRIDFRAVNIMPDSEKNVVILGLNKNHIFHVFNQEGKYLDSFGESFEIPAKYSQYKNFPQIKLPRRADRSRYGKIFLVNPHKYEIRIYEEKEVEEIIRHESELFSPLMIKPADEGRVSMVFPWVSVFEHKTKLYVNMRVFGQDALNQLDIFENDKYITSLKVNGFAYAIDKKGRLYFVEDEEYPKMLRCSLREK